MSEFVPIKGQKPVSIVAEIIAAAGERAAHRFLEFFAETIRNNTRLGYYGITAPNAHSFPDRPAPDSTSNHPERQVGCWKLSNFIRVSSR